LLMMPLRALLGDRQQQPSIGGWQIVQAEQEIGDLVGGIGGSLAGR
jgi:hypothetical protein